MAKITNETKKAFAVASILGAIVKSHNNGNPKLIALKIQVDKAMKVFSLKAKGQYYLISDGIKEAWFELADRYDNTLDEDELEVFIEMIANLIPKPHYKAFLGVSTFKTTHTINDEIKSSVLMSVLELDSMLNKMLGTTPTIDREGLAKVMVKPLKNKKVKAKRDMAVKPNIKKIRNRIKWNRERIKNVR